MKAITRIAAILLIAAFITAAAPERIWAAEDYRNYKGVWLGVASTDKDHDTDWTFSLINLTNSNVYIGAASETPSTSPYATLSDNFPYNTTFPPGNFKDTKVNLTTWKGRNVAHPFPGQYESAVNIHIQDGTNLYDFGLSFLMYSSGGVPSGSDAYVYFQPVYGSTSWKYNTQVTNDNGYYADPPRLYSSGAAYSEGIQFAISDKYVLCLYKPNEYNNGENLLFLVITQRFANNAYRGNHLQWMLH